MSTESKDLIAIEGVNLAAIFTEEDAATKIIEKIKALALAEAPDLTTAKGRDAIKSLAYKVSRTKVFMLEHGKSMSDEIKKKASGIDAARKLIEGSLDEIRDTIRQPLTDWEVEEERKKARMIQIFTDLKAEQITPHLSSDEISNAMAALMDGSLLAEVAQIAPEAMDEAQRQLLSTHSLMEQYLLIAKQREQDARELEELRAFKQEQARKQEAEAAEAAAREQQEKAREEEARRKEENEKREAEMKERIAKAAADRAAREIEEAKAKAERDAKEQIEAERRRIEKAAADKREEDERRAKNQRIRNAAGRAVMQSLTANIEGLAEEQARAIATAILDGKIARVKVEF